MEPGMAFLLGTQWRENNAAAQPLSIPWILRRLQFEHTLFILLLSFIYLGILVSNKAS